MVFSRPLPPTHMLLQIRSAVRETSTAAVCDTGAPCPSPQCPVLVEMSFCMVFLAVLTLISQSWKGGFICHNLTVSAPSTLHTHTRHEIQTSPARAMKRWSFFPECPPFQAGRWGRDHVVTQIISLKIPRHFTFKNCTWKPATWDPLLPCALPHHQKLSLSPRRAFGTCLLPHCNQSISPKESCSLPASFCLLPCFFCTYLPCLPACTCHGTSFSSLPSPFPAFLGLVSCLYLPHSYSSRSSCGTVPHCFPNQSSSLPSQDPHTHTGRHRASGFPFQLYHHLSLFLHTFTHQMTTLYLS